MARLSKTATAKDRFDHLLKVISSDRFLKKQGLGNEVPFFICPYPAEEAVGMEAMRASLLKQLENRGVRVVEINLYDLSVALLRERGESEAPGLAGPPARRAAGLEHLPPGPGR